jgi:energy-coupling factor transport system ATP-binding protein
VIELRKVSVEYGDRTVLRDVDLTVAEGELVLVAGRTGVGKSTLLGTFNGLVPAFTGGRHTGDDQVDGESVV